MADSSEAAAAVDPGKEEYRNECSHYQRGCSFVSPCCDKVYPCRLCHDDKELSHQIDRHAVTKIVCRKCSKKQPVSGTCVECGICFGRYFCSVCRLYDDRDKGQFHCDKCGLCRVGGRDEYYHCDTCGLCISLAMKEFHTCRRQMSRNNCPVCMEDIHTSRTAAHLPKCGHPLHMTCYSGMLKNGLYQCPQCQTSLGDMSSHWQAMDAEKAAWQLPQHLQNFKVKVSCRDCHKESMTDFHVVGFKCSECGGYNTVRCGNEEIPEDPSGDGVMGVIRRVARRVAGAGRRNQGEGDDQSDSSSNDEVHSSDSGTELDDDRGDDGPGSSAHRGNDQPDTEDKGHHHDDDTASGEPSGDTPGNHVRDDGVVDDVSYDGDESDSSEEFSSSSSVELFFDCVNHVQQVSPAMSRRKRRCRERRFIGRPIRSLTTDRPEWWESNDNEEGHTCSHTPTRLCHHSNTHSKKPHPPVQVMVEQLQVLEIWGSDYYTDSFSEVTSESCEEESGNVGVAYPRQQPVLKKGPSHENLQISLKRDSHSPPSLTRLYSAAPSLMYPIQNGLNSQSSCAHTYPIQNRPNHPHPFPVQSELGGPPTNALAERGSTNMLLKRNSEHCVSSWGRKSSSEESWFTANEDLELGTLV